MTRIFCIGETVLDLIFRGGALERALPGGSVLNAAVNLARSIQAQKDLGGPKPWVLGDESAGDFNAEGLWPTVHLVSECGQDPAGDLICAQVREAGVDTTWVHRYQGYPTALVQAGLNDSGQPSYTFSKLYPPERLALAHLPEFGPGDVVCLGSWASVDPELRPGLQGFLESARAAGALILYDPNFRPAYRQRLSEVEPWIRANLKLAHVVKASDEDLELIFGLVDPDSQAACVREVSGEGVLVRTAGAQDVRWWQWTEAGDFSGMVSVETIAPEDVVSAVGAGDCFQALLAWGLATGALHIESQSSGPNLMMGDLGLEGLNWPTDAAAAAAFWTPILERAARAAALVVQSPLNVLSGDEARGVVG
jgi:fructokinase